MADWIGADVNDSSKPYATSGLWRETPSDDELGIPEGLRELLFTDDVPFIELIASLRQLRDFGFDLADPDIQARAVRVARENAAKRDEERAVTRRVAEAYAEQSQVYYIRIGDWIKIGYTQNLRERLIGLRAPKTDVLAAEPGARDMEQRRHAEFALERRGRREDFAPSDRLLAHIETVRATHGEPRMTGYHGPATLR